MPPTPTISFSTNGEWKNKHLNVVRQYERLYDIANPQPGNGSRIVADMAATAKALQSIISDAVAVRKNLRCLGGSWSLSDAAATDQWLLSTRRLNLYWIMYPNQVSASYQRQDDVAGLYLLQCGMTVNDVNYYLENNGRALKTSGASNGQTIAGAIATGTHGSAFQYGALPEYVVGIHIILGPDRIIFLERASYPVVADDFASSLGAELIRDDDFFNAALVSFGSMGIIAGLMIETDKIYLLETNKAILQVNDALKKAMTNLDFSGLPLTRSGVTPWHFEITFDPHNATKGYCKYMYKLPYPTSGFQNPPRPAGALGPGEGMLSVIEKLTGIISGAPLRAAVATLVKSNLQPENPPRAVLATPDGTFPTTTLTGIAMSMELGIATTDAVRVLDLLLSLHPELDNYAGVISYRWVKQSSAMLGWTKFPITTTIEFNAVHNDRTLQYYRRI